MAAQTGKVELYEMRVAVNCHAPWILLRQSGLEYELKDIDLMAGEQKKPEFVAINPMHTVPTVRDSDGTALWETNAILRYLCNRYAKAAKFYPQDPVKRAHCDVALDWRQTVWYKNVSGLAYRKFGWMPKDEEAEAACRDAITRPNDGCFAILENHFLNGKPFICGDEPTIADFSIVPVFSFLDIVDMELPPGIAAYRKRFNDAVNYDEVYSGDGGFGTKAFIEMERKKGK
eukprot:TRINITY_DN3780_c1_g1_i1.p1 TRINITY_DN3780_c1_g1~~TRINITY_DN3780_c1_g1_i1.p1  ORF type:complete len:246 (+),score=77.93 TRINITY_DN3780_c1_g1_i1:46-738(+)